MAIVDEENIAETAGRVATLLQTSTVMKKSNVTSPKKERQMPG